MRVVVFPAIAIATVLTGCGSTTPATELLLADDPTSIAGEQTDTRPFLETLVGAWESPGCSGEFDCAIWTFEADGMFTYDFTTDDYSDSYSTRWSAQAVTDGVGRVSFENAGIHLVVIDDQGLRVLGQGNGFVKVGPGASVGDLAPVDPGPLGGDVVGTWLRPDGAAIEGVAQPEQLTLYGSGAFEATYGGETCTGVWTFDVAGDIGRNAGDPNEGDLALLSGELCNNRDTYRDRAAWDQINWLSLTSSDGSLFLDGLEYSSGPSSGLHFFGQNGTPVHVRIAEPVVAGEPAVLLIEIDQPMQYSRLADEVHSIAIYSSGSSIHTPGEEIVGDGTRIEISEPIEAVPGEPTRFELPIVFADANPSVSVHLSFEMFLDGERAVQSSPGARLSFEVAN